MRHLTKRLLLMVLLFAGVGSTLGPCGGEFDFWFENASRSQEAFRPHWSADAQAVIFRGRAQDGPQSTNVYKVGLDGASLKQIAKDAYWLDISPSNDRVLYTTTPHLQEEFRLDTVRLDGSDRHELTDSQLRASPRVWSPDGTRLAFHRNGYDDAGVYIMDSDGSDLQRFPVFETHEDSYIEGDVVSHFESERPVWSPDGRTLAFVIGERAGSHPDYSRTDVLYTFRIDGSDLTELFRTPPQASVQEAVHEPAWSPDGLRLAFVHASGRESVLYTIRADDSELRTLSPGLKREGLNVSNDVLAWSPDGSEILFEVEDSQHIYVADVESGRYQKLAPGLAASWSPDGSRIAVLGADFVPDAEIPVYGNGPCGVSDDGIAARLPYLYTMARDGSDVQVLVWRGEYGDLEEANPRPFLPWAQWQPC